jgi:hypothetical protein
LAPFQASEPGKYVLGNRHRRERVGLLDTMPMRRRMSVTRSPTGDIDAVDGDSPASDEPGTTACGSGSEERRLAATDGPMKR